MKACFLTAPALSFLVLSTLFSSSISGQQGGGAAENPKRLDEIWASLSEATTTLYYKNNARSDSIRSAAISRLLNHREKANPEQQKAVTSSINVFRQLLDAEAARAKAALKPANEQARVAMFLASALMKPNNVENALGDHMKESIELANKIRIAEGTLARQEAQMRNLWQTEVLPAIEKWAAPNTDRVLVEVRVGVLRQELWMAARNAAGRTLKNCTLVIRARLDKYEYPRQAIFVREWPAGQTIFPQFFTDGPIITPNGEAAVVARITSDFDFWCDEGHLSKQPAKAIHGFSIRDPFMKRIVSPGAKYFHVSQSTRATLEFTGLTKLDFLQSFATEVQQLQQQEMQAMNAALPARQVALQQVDLRRQNLLSRMKISTEKGQTEHVVSAKLVVQQLNGGNATVTNLVGNLIEDRSAMTSFHPSIMQFYLKSGTNSNAPYLRLRWNSGVWTVAIMTGPFEQGTFQMGP